MINEAAEVIIIFYFLSNEAFIMALDNSRYQGYNKNE